MLIRKANLDDAAQLMPLMAELGYPQSLEEMKQRIEIYSDGNIYNLLVAETDNKIVGLVAFVMYEIIVAPYKRCRVEGLVVDKNYRGQGIGHKLMAYVEGIAKESNCSIVDLTSGLRRMESGAHDFYKTIGYDNDGDRAKVYLRKELN
jgi:GNAT superfamily N-acetyltransferase